MLHFATERCRAKLTFVRPHLYLVLIPNLFGEWHLPCGSLPLLLELISSPDPTHIEILSRYEISYPGLSKSKDAMFAGHG